MRSARKQQRGKALRQSISGATAPANTDSAAADAIPPRPTTSPRRSTPFPSQPRPPTSPMRPSPRPLQRRVQTALSPSRASLLRPPPPRRDGNQPTPSRPDGQRLRSPCLWATRSHRPHLLRTALRARPPTGRCRGISARDPQASSPPDLPGTGGKGLPQPAGPDRPPPTLRGHVRIFPCPRSVTETSPPFSSSPPGHRRRHGHGTVARRRKAARGCRESRGWRTRPPRQNGSRGSHMTSCKH